MIRKYCDCCGEEIVEESAACHRIKGKSTRNRTPVEVEVHVAMNGTWNRGEICRACVVSIVHEVVGIPDGK